ncbi:RESERVOIR putative-RELATED [Salix purpurea]|uniref:RESERVOIR putative-RELATED n=1 Tax=Salix purpurea TaxID=77065 RepID=A0A9Q0Z3H2_SALPP|nr:RESERVOIR putative-RELATED [Salix purpurea]
METRHKLKLSLLALFMLLPSTKSSTRPDSRMLYQIACTMCSTCCGSTPVPPPPPPSPPPPAASPPPPATSAICPPPPSGGGSYYNSPPPPSTYTYSSPPPPQGGVVGGTYYPPPNYKNYPTPPPPNPIVPYFPFYYYSPPPPSMSASSLKLMASCSTDLGNQVAAELMHQRTRPGEQEKGPPFTLIWIKTIGIFGTETVNPSDNCEENHSPFFLLPWIDL